MENDAAFKEVYMYLHNMDHFYDVHETNRPSHGSPGAFTFHPWRIGLFFLCAAITMIFVAFMGAYVYLRVQGNLNPLHVPVIFYWNACMLYTADFLLKRADAAALAGQQKQCKSALIWCIVLTLFFFVGQVLGWKMLLIAGKSLTSGPLIAFLYIMSGVHLVHILMGIPFLLYYVKQITGAFTPDDDGTFFSLMHNALFMHLLKMYWAFLNWLWWILLIFLTINSFIPT